MVVNPKTTHQLCVLTSFICFTYSLQLRVHFNSHLFTASISTHMRLRWYPTLTPKMCQNVANAEGTRLKQFIFPFLFALRARAHICACATAGTHCTSKFRIERVFSLALLSFCIQIKTGWSAAKEKTHCMVPRRTVCAHSVNAINWFSSESYQFHIYTVYSWVCIGVHVCHCRCSLDPIAHIIIIITPRCFSLPNCF